MSHHFQLFNVIIEIKPSNLPGAEDVLRSAKTSGISDIKFLLILHRGKFLQYFSVKAKLLQNFHNITITAVSSFIFHVLYLFPGDLLEKKVTWKQFAFNGAFRLPLKFAMFIFDTCMQNFRSSKTRTNSHFAQIRLVQKANTQKRETI